MKRLIELLNNHPQVDEWQIRVIDTSSTELFFIKDDLQMNRKKDVNKITITVYKNFEENGKKFKGSSSTNLSNVYTEDEIIKKIDQAALAASFVKNEYYDLVEPTNDIAPQIESAFSKGNPVQAISNLVNDLYEEDNQFGAFVNSSEFFINKIRIGLANSNGLDVHYEKYTGEIELITEAHGEKESIELFEVIHFSDYDSEFIKEQIKEKLYQTSLRAKAVPMPNIDNIPVILRSASTTRIWDYYLSQASAGQKYQHIHENNVGDTIQEAVSGDLITLTMKPVIHNSTRNTYYDLDGFFLKDQTIIKEGKLEKLLASKRYSHYLNIETTGGLNNVVVDPGTKSLSELKEKPYLEVLAFSDFQTDAMTGNFGGEFRLALYFDGEKEIPVTLGTVTGNLKDAHKDMHFSKETCKSDSFIGPKYIKFDKMTIAGN